MIFHKHYIQLAEQGNETKFESHIHSLKTVIPGRPTSQVTLDDHISSASPLRAVFNDCRSLVGQGARWGAWVREPVSRVSSATCCPFQGERRLLVTQRPEGSGSWTCLPSSSGGSGLSQPDPLAGLGRTSGKSWPRSGVQTMISKWSNGLWKLWGDARELSGPHKHWCHRWNWEISDNRRSDTGRCHGCPSRYTMSDGWGHLRGDGAVNGIDGTCDMSSSPLETKWPGMKWHVGSLGTCC